MSRDFRKLSRVLGFKVLKLAEFPDLLEEMS